MADDLGAGKGRDRLRRVLIHLRIHQQRHRQLQFGEHFGQTEHADAVAIVAPGVIEHVRRRTAGREFRAEPFAEREPFEIERDIDGQPFAAGPVVNGAGGDWRVGVAGVVAGRGHGFILTFSLLGLCRCRPGRAERGPGPIRRSLSMGCGVWVPACAGTTQRVRHASSPVFFAAPGTPSSISSSPRKIEGMARQAARHAVKSRAVAGTWRLSARHGGDFCSRRVRVSWDEALASPSPASSLAERS